MRRSVYLHIQSTSTPIARLVTVYAGTIREQCAIDALLSEIDHDRDLVSYADCGDLELYVDYVKRCNANKRAIAKEEQKDYIL